MSFLNDRALRLFDRQFGIASRPQLLDCGHSGGQIEGWVRRRLLVIVYCGVYRVRGGGAPREQPAMAAVLRCRPKAWVTGGHLLALLGTEGFGLDHPVEVLVPPGRCVRKVPFSVRTDPGYHRDRARLGALPVVTGARAIVDVADDAKLPDRKLLTAIDALRWARGTSVDTLLRCAGELPHHAGAQRILSLVRDGLLAQESHGERHMAMLFEHSDLAVEWQVWIAPHIRVDVLLRDVALVVEYLGDVHLSEIRRAQDRKRHREIRALQYSVVYMTKRDLSPVNLPVTRARLLAMRDALAQRLPWECSADA